MQQGKVLNGYQCVARLGKGGFGEVWRCSKDGKEYAVKMIDEEDTTSNMEKFFAENIKLNSPFLVKYHLSFRELGKVFIVMELCSKKDLKIFIEELKKRQMAEKDDMVLSVKRIMRIFIELLIGLFELHRNKLLHRDIKPENVFIDGQDDVKIGDFGCVKALDYTSAKANTVIGTPFYMSPEVIEENEYDASCDIWSLGVLMYQLCVLELPFTGKSRRQVENAVIAGNYKPIGEYLYPEPLTTAVHSMLSVDPKKRPTAEMLLSLPIVQSFANQLDLRKYLPTTVGTSLTPAQSPSSLTPSSNPSLAQLQTQPPKQAVVVGQQIRTPPPAAGPSAKIMPPPSTRAASSLSTGSASVPVPSPPPPPPPPPGAVVVLAYPGANDRYEGAVRMDVSSGVQKPHGKGVCVYHGSLNRIYDGDWVDGKKEGKGTMTLRGSDKRISKYVGDWVNDKEEGKGTFMWAVGDVYVGDYVKGKREGKGKWTGHAGGSFYEGGWWKDMKHGYGKDEDRTGEWRRDVPVPRSFIPYLHPLIMYAGWCYTPPASANSSDFIVDLSGNVIEKGLREIALRERCPYLLRRLDYPFQHWCQVIPLLEATTFSDKQAYQRANGGKLPTHLFSLTSGANADGVGANVHDRLRGGYAPLNYFPDAEVAKVNLRSNPGCLDQALHMLTGEGEDEDPEKDSDAPLSQSQSQSHSSQKGRKITYKMEFEYKDEDDILKEGEILYSTDEKEEAIDDEVQRKEWILLKDAKEGLHFVPRSYIKKI